MLRHTMIALIMLVIGLSGCATMSPPQHRTDRRLLATKVVTIQEPGQLVLVSREAGGTPYRFQVQRQQMCHQVTRDQVEYQAVTYRESKHVAADIVGGILMGGAGGVCVAIAPKLSNEDNVDGETGEKRASDRSMAYVGAVTGIGFGLWALINGIHVASASADFKSSPPNRIEEDHNPSAESVCGTLPIGNGRIRAVIAGSVLHEQSVSGGDFIYDVLANRKTLCGDEDRLGSELSLTYAEGSTTLALGHFDIDECIVATSVKTRLMQVDGQLDDQLDPDEFVKLGSDIGAISTRISKLPDSNQEKSQFTAALSEINQKIRTRLDSSLTNSIAGFQRSVEDWNLDNILPEATQLMLISQNLAERKAEVWSAIYKPLGIHGEKHPSEFVPVLQRILSEDAVGRNCLLNSECPDWLSHEVMVQNVRTGLEAPRRELQGKIAQLEKISGKLKKQPKEKVALEVQQRLAELDELTRSCPETSWDQPWAASCQSAQTASLSAREVLAASQSKLQKQKVARTAAKWRAYLGRCKTLREVGESYRAISHCDASCQAIMRRANNDWRTLFEFKVDDPAYDVESLQELRTQCQETRCPVCP